MASEQLSPKVVPVASPRWPYFCNMVVIFVGGVIVIFVGGFLGFIGVHIYTLTENGTISIGFERTVSVLWLICGLLGLLIAAVGIVGATIVTALERRISN